MQRPPRNGKRRRTHRISCAAVGSMRLVGERMLLLPITCVDASGRDTFVVRGRPTVDNGGRPDYGGTCFASREEPDAALPPLLVVTVQPRARRGQTERRSPSSRRAARAARGREACDRARAVQAERSSTPADGRAQGLGRLRPRAELRRGRRGDVEIGP